MRTQCQIYKTRFILYQKLPYVTKIMPLLQIMKKRSLDKLSTQICMEISLSRTEMRTHSRIIHLLSRKRCLQSFYKVATNHLNLGANLTAFSRVVKPAMWDLIGRIVKKFSSSRQVSQKNLFFNLPRRNPTRLRCV